MMQPPTSELAYMPLRKQLEQLQHASRRQVPKKSFKQIDLLSEKLQAWAKSMTPEQRMRRFTTEEVERLAGLVGKHGGRAAHHQISIVLRHIGFQHCRDWSVAGRNRRFWQFSRDAK
jgi:hypothetical protein